MKNNKTEKNMLILAQWAQWANDSKVESWAERVVLFFSQDCFEQSMTKDWPYTYVKNNEIPAARSIQIIKYFKNARVDDNDEIVVNTPWGDLFL